ncbi:response regulator [Corallococcus sp. AB011P]|uniref:response regulator n=1 Tax=Corallococcus sp. AB011P TaxID=2316735 RepID=UPI000EA0394F|nr:response regulator [Corallococcus sp. AB011P]RKG59856.1 response regulator [Corallococcus sp. AB011P]
MVLATMVNVLLIEDDENKRGQLAALIEAVVPNVSLFISKSLNSGLRSLVVDRFDFVILDMTMPSFDIGPDDDGGRPQAYGGREILQQMDRRGIKTPVIVVTQFDRFGEGKNVTDLSELDSQLRLEHPDIYQGVVYYNVALTGWREALLAMIRTVSAETLVVG